MSSFDWSRARGLLGALWEGKSSRIGMIILAFYFLVALVTPIAYPYDYVTSHWIDPNHWRDNPRLAQPTWVNLLTGRNLPDTIIIDSRDKGDPRVYKQDNIIGGFGFKEINIQESFFFSYDDFPSEITLRVFSNFTGGFPLLNAYFSRPDGKEIHLISSTITSSDVTFYISLDTKIVKVIANAVRSWTGEEANYTDAHVALFAVADRGMSYSRTAKLLKGRYGLRVSLLMQDMNGVADVRLVVYGKVFGLAGTDSYRRDLMISLLWGDPIAIAFGFTASFLITFLQSFVAIAGAWKGGTLDSIIQRIAEIYMVVPFLNILIIVSMFYKLSIWNLLISVVLLSLFGGGMKGTRSQILQIKEETYVEAATSYGASDLRIVFMYLWPRILPLVVPGLIGAIPGFIFLESALAVLGLGDPTLPTWGKSISEAYSTGAAYQGYWWWLAMPIAMIIGIAIAFASIGYSLEKMVNPRLKEQ